MRRGKGMISQHQRSLPETLKVLPACAFHCRLSNNLRMFGSESSFGHLLPSWITTLIVVTVPPPSYIPPDSSLVEHS